MTKQELTIKLDVLLERYEALIVEVEGWQRQGVEGVHPAFFSGQIDILVTVCTDLEALVLEANGQPMPGEWAGVAERHEEEGGQP